MRPPRPAHAKLTYGGLLRQREFGALLSGDVLSLAGDRIAAVAVTYLVFARSHSPFLAALAYASSYLPWVLGAPFLASVADRFPRRRVMIVCDLCRIPMVGLLAIPGTPNWLLITVLGAAGFFNPAFEAARAAMLPDVLPGESYLLGSSLNQMAVQLMQVIGLVAGGVVVAALTARGGLLFDAGTFAASAVLVRLFVRERPVTGASDSATLRGTLQGARLVLRTPGLRRLLFMAVTVASVLVVPESLAVVRARHFGSSALLAGALMSAVPLGMTVSMVVLGRYLGSQRASRLMLPLAALAFVPLLGTVAPLPFGGLIVLWVVAGLGGGFQLPANTQFMLAVSNGYRGRAFGLAQSLLFGTQALTMLAAGALALSVGPSWTVFMAAAVGCLLLPLVPTAGDRHASPQVLDLTAHEVPTSSDATQKYSPVGIDD